MDGLLTVAIAHTQRPILLRAICTQLYEDHARRETLTRYLEAFKDNDTELGEMGTRCVEKELKLMEKSVSELQKLYDLIEAAR